MMGLTVRRNTISGRRPGCRRWSPCCCSILTLATSGLLLLVALFTTRHRTLHDLVSGLVVVRAGALTDDRAEAGTCTAERPAP